MSARWNLASAKFLAVHAILKTKWFARFRDPRVIWFTARNADSSSRRKESTDSQISSSRNASAQVRQVVHAHAARDSAQTLAHYREEAAQQPALAEPFDSGPPALGGAAEPLEDSG
jgi:hypothetical protein